MAKENNTISEQIFQVSFQVTDSTPTNIQSATIHRDYYFGSRSGQTSQTFPFLPSEQRIPFLFQLLADTLPERNEAFQARVSPADTLDLGNGMVEQLPTYRSPLTLSYTTLITIV